MNAVGIDVSKGKSTVAVMQPFGVVAASPFEVAHTENELKELAKFLKSFSGETKVVMEYTGSYYEPIASFLHNEGIYVSVVNAILIHNYSGNSVRKAKTDKKDSVRIAQYALDRWLDLREYIPEPSTVTAPLYSVCIEGVRLTCLDGMNGSLSAVSTFQSCWKFSSMIRKDSLKLFPLAAFTVFWRLKSQPLRTTRSKYS